MSLPPLLVHFSSLTDPRMDRTKHHSLVDILTIAFCSVLCGAEGWEDMEAFGLAKEPWLRERLGLSLAHGIPSEDTFRRLFARLDPDAFGRCFVAWVQTFRTLTKGEVIAIDGKALRHSFDTATGQSALHLVSAWASESGLSLGQVKVADKSNEITAIPALLSLLDITGCVITTDAMGCQKSIARQIKEKQGDWLFSLKGNQATLHQDVKLFFEDARQNDFYQNNPDQRITYRYQETIEKDHGRLETRRCFLVEGKEIDWLSQKDDWFGLQSLGAVECERRILHPSGDKSLDKVTRETRYFISSLCGSVKRFAHAVRAHWGIENRLHWVLDVAFEEDDCPIAIDHGPENFATLRKTAFNLLKKDKTTKAGIKAKSKKAGWDDTYLLDLLTN
jgi:predicted transposase YbfD/YdcC